MHAPAACLWLAKPELSDEAAAQRLDFLYELITGFENACFDQLHRYYVTSESSADNLPQTSRTTKTIPSDSPVIMAQAEHVHTVSPCPSNSVIRRPSNIVLRLTIEAYALVLILHCIAAGELAFDHETARWRWRDPGPCDES